MNDLPSSRRAIPWRWLTVTLVLTWWAGAIASAQATRPSVLYVSKGVARILEGPAGFYPAIAEAPKGTELKLLAVEGKWYKVALGNKVGYVLADNAGPERPSGVDWGAMRNRDNTGANPAEVKAASGLMADAEQTARQRNLRLDGLKQIEAERKKVIADTKTLTAFTMEIAQDRAGGVK
jgi:uncharacterized protein YgiM (DUF1202 family)